MGDIRNFDGQRGDVRRQFYFFLPASARLDKLEPHSGRTAGFALKVMQDRNQMTKIFGGLLAGLVFGLSLAFGINAFSAENAGAADEKKKAVETANAPKAIGPYSQAIVADDFVFVSGQIGIDPKTGNLVEGGIRAETEQVLKNLGEVLRAAKSNFDNVVKATIFLADINDFALVNEIYAKHFKSPYPARATVQVARLPRDARIEIEVTAIKK